MNVLIMGGTSDANKISEELKKLNNIYTVITTTTNHGSELARKHANKVISRQDNKETFEDIIKNNNISILIDATHPFAINASKRALQVSKDLNIPYIRYERPQKFYENAIYVKDFKEASRRALEISKKNIMYLAGIKNLKNVVEIIGKDRLIARVLPISVNEALNILPSKNIIGMQGIFSKELNRYLIMDYNCDVIITKDSGDSGGLNEKVMGAIEANATPIIVERPKLYYPLMFDNINDLLNYILNYIKSNDNTSK
ncbi:precorrin-6A reductase [Methanothermococcus okinawensis]|uniref:Precorrin-6x reductase n=1 Tax=Methanothermococcus okinawensis (strain DSM 14208 / JCM 11175 / IH1) TaxID=647113 RepID=F8AN89_METOI|nr:precorrin-6A reductase [Methanothermococcus okinawensis]AEH06148.1 precorrin-6x reductase [Methanothermococcus okinawensis IH1]